MQFFAGIGPAHFLAETTRPLGRGCLPFSPCFNIALLYLAFVFDLSKWTLQRYVIFLFLQSIWPDNLHIFHINSANCLREIDFQPVEEKADKRLLDGGSKGAADSTFRMGKDMLQNGAYPISAEKGHAAIGG